MQNRIKKMVEEALRVFEKTTGLEAYLQAEYLNNTKYPDGLVRIAHQDMQLRSGRQRALRWSVSCCWVVVFGREF